MKAAIIMRALFLCSRLLTGTVVAASGSGVSAQSAGETIRIPMLDKASKVPAPINLEATLHKPAGQGPFPIVVFNHGSTGPGVIPRTQTENLSGFGSYLNKRGIALLIPMRRGRGKSEGKYDERYSCDLVQSRRGIAYASESIDAALDYLRGQAWADMGKVVLLGHSRGGMLSVIYAADHPGVTRGVINFAGGWVGVQCTQFTGVDVNATLFAEAGAKARDPNLFIYARGDSYYFDTSMESYVKAFESGGGSVAHRLFTLKPGAEGHMIFHSYYQQWIPDVDAFLRRIGVWNTVNQKRD